MLIISQIKEVIWFIMKFVLLSIALVAVSMAAPLVLAVLPQIVLFRNPTAAPHLALLFFWGTPVTVAVWMIFLTHWHSAILAVRENRSSTWRKDHGGMVATCSKSIGFAVLGFFGSFVCEFAFFYLTSGHLNSLFQAHIWFAAFPFVAYAPVILLLLKRRNYSEGRPADLKATAEKTADLTNSEYKAFLKKELADRTADGEISIGDWLELRKANGF